VEAAVVNSYLSSYKLGNEVAALKRLGKQTSGSLGYIANALDFTSADPERKQRHIDQEMSELRELGFDVTLLDLRDYFGDEDDLDVQLQRLGGVYVCGGNSFVLRQAMQLSGFDGALRASCDRADFLYAGYSAGVCVLSPTLHAYAIVDDPTDMPYPQLRAQLWEGLGLLSFVFLPHYRSDHPESAQIDQEIAYCIDNKVLFKAYRDGEVLIIE
jgi:dipeptidase E